MQTFVALDQSSVSEVLSMIDLLKGEVDGFKIGSAFLYNNLRFSEGRTVDDLTRIRRATSLPLLLDLKVHDTVNTTRLAIRGLLDTGYNFFTISLLCGPVMLRAALDEVAKRDPDHRLIGVGFPSSMSQAVMEDNFDSTYTLKEIGHNLCTEGYDEGLRAFVCSADEAQEMRVMLVRDCGGVFLWATGIRTGPSFAGDNERVGTPTMVAAADADYQILGRIITEANDPIAALEHVHNSVKEIA